MVAVLLGQGGGVVLGALFDLHDLGGAGLARHRVLQAHAQPRAGAARHHALHAALHVFEVFLLERNLADGHRFDDARLAAAGVHHLLHQVWLEHLAVVGEDGGGVGHLQRGVGVEALADADADHVGRIPAAEFLFVAGEAARLPFLGRQHADGLAVQIDAALAAQAELRQRRVDLVYAHVPGQLVEEGVAGDFDRALQIDHAVAGLLAVAELVAGAGQGEVAGRRADVAHADGVVLQCRHRHEGLEGGAGRVGAAQRAVDHRLLPVVVQIGPGLGVDAVDEQIGVEARFGQEGEHAAGGRLYRHQRAAAVAEQFVRHFLQADVQRQLQGIAVDRRRAAQRTHRAAAGVGFHFFEADLAVQVVFVHRFQTGLAYVVGALVIGGFLFLFQPLLVALVDAADVAEHMAGHFLERIVAEQPRLDLHAGEAPGLGGDARGLFLAELGFQRDGFEVLAFDQQALELALVARGDVHQLAQLGLGGGQVGDLAGRQLQRVGGVVLRQHHAVAVQDQAAVGQDGHQRDAVVLRQRGKVFVLQHLQPDEAGEQHQEHQHDQRVSDDQAQLELAVFGLRVLEAGRLRHGRSAALHRVVAVGHQHQLGQQRPQQRADQGRQEIAPADEGGAGQHAHHHHDDLVG